MEYGFTPQQVGEMTLYQIQVYMREEKDLGSGRIKTASITEAKAQAKAVQTRMARTIGRIKEYIRGTQIRRSIRKHTNQ